MGRVIAGKVIALKAVIKEIDEKETPTDKDDINPVNLLIEGEVDEKQPPPEVPVEDDAHVDLPVDEEPENETDLPPNQPSKKVRYIVRRTAVRYGRRRR